MASASQISFHSGGRLGAERLVAVVRSGPVALDDPDPAATAARRLRLLLVEMPALDTDAPESLGVGTLDEEHAAALVDLLRDEGASPSSPIGLVGVGRTGWRAVAAAATLDGAVDRLALVALPVPASALDQDQAAELLARVEAKTLIMAGSNDPAAPAASAAFIKRAHGSGRVEMVPAGAALSIVDVWERVLSHAAPGTRGS